MKKVQMVWLQSIFKKFGFSMCFIAVTQMSLMGTVEASLCVNLLDPNAEAACKTEESNCQNQAPVANQTVYGTTAKKIKCLSDNICTRRTDGYQCRLDVASSQYQYLLEDQGEGDYNKSLHEASDILTSVIFGLDLLATIGSMALMYATKCPALTHVVLNTAGLYSTLYKVFEILTLKERLKKIGTDFKEASSPAMKNADQQLVALNYFLAKEKLYKQVIVEKIINLGVIAAIYMAVIFAGIKETPAGYATCPIRREKLTEESMLKSSPNSKGHNVRFEGVFIPTPKSTSPWYMQLIESSFWSVAIAQMTDSLNSRPQNDGGDSGARAHGELAVFSTMSAVSIVGLIWGIYNVFNAKAPLQLQDTLNQTNESTSTTSLRMIIGISLGLVHFILSMTLAMGPFKEIDDRIKAIKSLRCLFLDSTDSADKTLSCSEEGNPYGVLKKGPSMNPFGIENAFAVSEQPAAKIFAPICVAQDGDLDFNCSCRQSQNCRKLMGIEFDNMPNTIKNNPDFKMTIGLINNIQQGDYTFIRSNPADLLLMSQGMMKLTDKTINAYNKELSKQNKSLIPTRKEIFQKQIGDFKKFALPYQNLKKTELSFIPNLNLNQNDNSQAKDILKNMIGQQGGKFDSLKGLLENQEGDQRANPSQDHLAKLNTGKETGIGGEHLSNVDENSSAQIKRYKFLSINQNKYDDIWTMISTQYKKKYSEEISGGWE